jgi:bifunctional non-homologous end joining protein LigD
MARKPQLDIETYNRKRDFTRTKEPKGRKLKGKGDSFVVQKHEASRLHWDFRLELDGVLKSWAVPKGPSLDPDDKRLAVRTEDHPLDYGDFEGVIPKGEYGGGTVMLWDKGRWEPEPGKDPSQTIEEGHLHFTLEGERMKGEWVMFRLKGRPGDRQEPWMLKKVDDQFARPDEGEALVEQCVTSVTTDRSMAEIAAGTDVWHSNRKATGKAAGRNARPALARPSSRRRSWRRWSTRSRVATTGCTNINMTDTAYWSRPRAAPRLPSLVMATTGATSSGRSSARPPSSPPVA